MKNNTVFVALVLAVISVITVVDAQKSYPACMLDDCVGFLGITVGCGYTDTDLDMTSTQVACICQSTNGAAEYQKCVGCMNLDTTLSAPYPSQCSANLVGSTPSSSTTRSATSASASRSTGTSRSASTGSSRSATGASSPTGQAVPTVVPTGTSENLQGFGGCPNGDCSGGDSTKANIYDVTKDSNAASEAGNVRGVRGGWYTVLGLAMAGIVWL